MTEDNGISPGEISPQSPTEFDPAPEFYIPAVGSLTERRTRTIKQGDTFAVFDCDGNILSARDRPDGLFHRDTRYLSHLQLLVEGEHPLLLSSAVHDVTAALTSDLTNPDLYLKDGHLLRENLHMSRAKFLWQGCLYERLSVRNFDTRTHRIAFTVRFGSDFADLFEARGQRRARRGQLETPKVLPSGQDVELAYVGVDGIRRTTCLHFDPVPVQLAGNQARFELDLKPGARCTVFITMSFAGNEPVKAGRRQGFFIALHQKIADRRAAIRPVANIATSNDLFNEVVRRSEADLTMLTTETEQGLYPYAGIPWFSTPFGRDGIITALLLLWAAPSVAAGVLCYLAAHQARDEDPEADAEPGKILHETRGGEMAGLGEVPFGKYYGSIDSTPLFVMLAGAYFDRTGDIGLATELWPHVEAALGWIDRYGDIDGDGFIEYARRSRHGLANQGWKDSHDSVFHADGSPAEGPIALCEVQGYAYAARRAGARLARALGQHQRAEVLDQQAKNLRRHFDAAFWCPDIGTYALALDGAKQPCRVRSSNPGHDLFAGIVPAERADTVAATLMTAESFSGWGVRTVATGEPRYNPMSYHNGSVWPHDNALIALGLARYGHKEAVRRIFRGLFDAAIHFDLRRLPELFCGFPRRQGRGPVSYPVACSPQAWASAAPFGLLQAAVGLEFDPDRCEIRFIRPLLPRFLEEVHLHGLRLRDAEVDIVLRRHATDVGVNVTRRSGTVRVVTVS
jgi:glycogen debranching enzyme